MYMSVEGGGRERGGFFLPRSDNISTLKLFNVDVLTLVFLGAH